MSHQTKLGYLSMNLGNITEHNIDQTLIVNSANVCIDRRVKQGKHWNKKWRANIDTDSLWTLEKRVWGTIIGYTDENGQLYGQNCGGKYNQVQQGQANWCVVRWDNQNVSLYPIGAQGVYAWAYAVT